MTENKRYVIVGSNFVPEGKYIKDNKTKHTFPTTTKIASLIMYEQVLNEQEEQIKKANQEITACHDTLVTIEALCDAVLNHDFKNTESKVDFCKMLNEMDNKDLAFLKECFEAIRDNDLKKMTSLTAECLSYMEGNFL